MTCQPQPQQRRQRFTACPRSEIAWQQPQAKHQLRAALQNAGDGELQAMAYVIRRRAILHGRRQRRKAKGINEKRRTRHQRRAGGGEAELSAGIVAWRAFIGGRRRVSAGDNQACRRRSGANSRNALVTAARISDHHLCGEIDADVNQRRHDAVCRSEIARAHLNRGASDRVRSARKRRAQNRDSALRGGGA